MSYLQYPRLAFSGLFQSDVSTVNNDPRHFDSASFKSHFQEPTYSPPLEVSNGATNVVEMNGWWNPFGTGIFGFKNCVVQSVLNNQGLMQKSAAEDGAIGLSVGNACDQPSGKMVDLDPDWQLASNIFGQVVTLRAANGQILMQGKYAPNPFRDLWFNRVGNLLGDSAASAIWQTVLTDVVWNLAQVNSQVLRDLQAICVQQNNTLSLRMTTYAYDDNLGDSFFSYGLVLGAIGPANPTEPASFILGRRFIPASSLMPAASYQATDYFPNVGWFSAQLVGDTLYADLSNALPLLNQPDSTLETSYVVNVTSGSGSGNPAAPTSGNSSQSWQQPFSVALLNSTTLPSSPYLSPSQYQPLATVDTSNANLLSCSGIVAVKIPPSVQGQIQSLPLALISGANPNTGIVLLLACEGPGGWELRADQFAFRLDPNAAGEAPNGNQQTSTVFIAQYGVPLANGEVSLALTSSGPQVDTGDCPSDNPPQTTPKAAMPTTNVPPNQITLQVQGGQTDAYGRINILCSGPQTMGYPRYYIDGQLYNYNYNFASGSKNGTATTQQSFDQYAIVVRSSYTVPLLVSWDDVQPILQQYANLYPVMSQGLFDFSIKEQADANAFILKFVFDKTEDDPDQMPVTRDLSSSKRQALIQYFDQVLVEMGRPKNMLEIFGNRCPTRGGGPLREGLHGADAASFSKGGSGKCPHQ